ncbi:ribosome assembly RNA-binding protein YhbY [Limosilactobacillus fastidiosus]|uniref:Ribosome assembly RNA-binding protein YhbY n=1 Tax=Limosilactobacillus fastidiosus TaxID=2759855 RepID=A0A7W3U184_9LACO|nr:ribosome assembly RNA-binding protein YhbY [Limosilactobacillus fastidiosus]MBB1063691.1 ribosome assembly RNA-binding protein YhbY [Limosilactobacillus fastidiosus]MBB1086780.1 ribosome assembly RNA-binding protein YhbY [Limosilactobacillus fastidiosus]MCD7084266.1 ribosome assembly RNA-binding protein YhbY [Limosilactobacillus fastidiosus]MCD7085493.1 ribosome assembly RNA-binding protein YhbY [Limosilactobacillus fastidiosus]MCD7114724.1 ribosome assembly RNA-binding protein YhbY [Limosi
MELRGKQKRFLRAHANHLQPIFSVGKEGLTQNWVDQLDGALDRRELIKVNILQNADVTTKEVQHFIESQTEIQVVQIIGRVLILFKESKNKDARELSSRVKKI